MRWIIISFYLIVVALTAAWIAADGTSVVQTSFFALRDGAIQYSGVLALGAMSVGVFLATRPTWLEPYLNGLDKMYRLHKWLGIVGLIGSIGHWFFATGFTWLMPLGIIAAPAGGGGRPEGPPAGTETGLQQIHGLAKVLGEWSFYLLVILVAIALIKLIPYRYFASSHRLLSVLYLVLVFHAVVLLEAAYWLQPIGILMAVLMVLGSVSAILDLLHWPARTRRVAGSISSLHYYPELAVLEIAIKLDPGWKGHRPGQFAFVKTGPSEAAHPYTMASDWADEGNEMTFVTKALGDYTRRMATTLKTGDAVTVEGPYGRFDFADGNQRQIWVAGGIGITPFIARMKELQRRPPEQRLDFYHATSDVSEHALDKLRADASAAGVQLHIIAGKEVPRLTAERIKRELPDWKEASIWFCGPPSFGQALRRDFIRAGGRSSRFHQEMFEMR